METIAYLLTFALGAATGYYVRSRKGNQSKPTTPVPQGPRESKRRRTL